MVKRKKVSINSSLNVNFLILEVFRLYKIVLMIWCFPNALRGSVSMSSSKCDQVYVNRTLRSGDRGQNEGKFDGSGCDKEIEFLKITLNKSKSKQNRDSQCCLSNLS